MGKNRSASGLTNVIQYDNNGNIAFVSGSTTLMQVSSSGAITTTGTISGGDAADALLLNGTGSLAFVTTASYNVASASFSSRTTQVERTYATTGSNTFTGAQFASDTSNAISFTSTASLYSDGGLRVQGNSFVSGTAYFNNIVVYGTSSIQYITSSQVNVGTNIITVNTDTPAVRFGGLAVFDSGSTQLTGSILWDSEKNHWVYSNPSGSTYSGGMFISGPRSSALGSEQGTTACMLLVGQGSDHLTSSLIYHDSTRTCFYGNSLFVSASCQVGIGTSSPQQILSINNPFASNGALYPIVISQQSSNEIGGMYSVADAITNPIGAGLAWKIYKQNTGLIEGMRITSGGNVGIGTCNPLSLSSFTSLEVKGPFAGLVGISSGCGSAFGRMYNPGSTIYFGTSTNHPIVFDTNDVERMRITNCGIACFSNIVCAPNLISTDATHTTLRMSCTIVPLANYRTSDCGYGGADFFDNGKGYACAAKFYTFKTSTEYYGLTNDYNGSAQLSLVSCGGGAGNNISFFTGTSNVAKMRIDNCATCISCQLSVGPSITIGNQGGTDTTVIGGGSGVGSLIRMNYAGGAFNNYLAGNGDNFFNCLLGKLNAAGGIKFGGGSGTLNHYESGTWTPQLYWSSGGQYCMSGGNGGNYVRVGNVVSVNYTLQWSGLCGSSGFGGQLRIGGLPFNIGSYRSAGTISAISSGIGRSGTNITWHANTVDPGANFIYWIENDPTGGYGHSPSVGASGLVYSNQVTYALQ
jgi:hypothetical protein